MLAVLSAIRSSLSKEVCFQAKASNSCNLTVTSDRRPQNENLGGNLTSLLNRLRVLEKKISITENSLYKKLHGITRGAEIKLSLQDF